VGIEPTPLSANPLGYHYATGARLTPGSTEGNFTITHQNKSIGLENILNYLEEKATAHEFPPDRYFLLVVDINIYWRMSHWIIDSVHMSQWQLGTFLPILGSWHPLKVLC
jgi:hypothetical protein